MPHTSSVTILLSSNPKTKLVTRKCSWWKQSENFQRSNAFQNKMEFACVAYWKIDFIILYWKANVNGGKGTSATGQWQRVQRKWRKQTRPHSEHPTSIVLPGITQDQERHILWKENPTQISSFSGNSWAILVSQRFQKHCHVFCFVFSNIQYVTQTYSFWVKSTQTLIIHRIIKINK